MTQQIVHNSTDQ